MKSLESDQVKKLIRNPRNKENIERLKLIESKLRVYSEPMPQRELDEEDGWADFQANLQTSLTSQRYRRILEFMTYPLETTSITDTIIKELSKVFESTNSFFNINAGTPELKERAEELVVSLDLRNWIQTNGKDVMRSKANSIVVLDFDEEGSDKPYLNLIRIDQVIDYDLKTKDGELSYVIFMDRVEKTAEGNRTYYHAYDEQYYSTFVEDNGKIEPLIQIPHKLQSCPARFFWSQSLTEKNINYRSTPLIPVLGSLEKWQRFNLFKFYQDHYIPFPVVEMISEKCSQENCKGGKIHEEEEYQNHDGEIVTRIKTHDCQVCANKKPFGPGTKISHKVPKDKDNFDPFGKFKFIQPPTEGLEYVDDKILMNGKNSIINSVIGSGGMIQKEAINELQTIGSFESKQQVLLDLKVNYDKLHKWIAESSIKLIYGANSDVSMTANYGTQFFLYDSEYYLDQFKKAKEAGQPQTELANWYMQYVETKYRNNPVEIDRQRILKQIEPIPFQNMEQAIELRRNGVISREDLIVKGNFTNFVDRFEREQGAITYFGIDTSMESRVNSIKDVIYGYIPEEDEPIVEQINNSNE